MLLTTLVLILGATNLTTSLGVLGFRWRNKRLNKENASLKKDHAEMSETLGEVLADHISPKHVSAYLKAVKAANHKWMIVNESPMRWGTKVNKEDTLITRKCKCCGIVERFWERGLGVIDAPQMAGFWIGDRKLLNNEKLVYECQAITDNEPAQKLLEKNEEIAWETQTLLK